MCDVDGGRMNFDTDYARQIVCVCFQCVCIWVIRPCILWLLFGVCVCVFATEESVILTLNDYPTFWPIKLTICTFFLPFSNSSAPETFHQNFPSLANKQQLRIAGEEV